MTQLNNQFLTNEELQQLEDGLLEQLEERIEMGCLINNSCGANACANACGWN